MKNKILLFPGFSQDKILYGDYSYINIWEEKYTKYDLSNTEYLIGHSMGSLACLLNWKENPKTRVVLFNPLIPKRSNFNIVLRFINMILFSKGTIRAVKGHTHLKYLPVAIRNALFLLKTDPIEIIKGIPKDKILILKGEDDKYFCDSYSVEIFKKYDIPFTVMKGIGHYWVPEVDSYVKKLTNQ